MRKRMFSEFEKICKERNAGGNILEIGAIPSEESLLNIKSFKNVKEKVGINLNGNHNYKDFNIIKGNANAMDNFKNQQFDTVLCNAVFEHDKFFWKTMSEIKRVTKPGGVIILGAPGYTESTINKIIRTYQNKIPVICKILKLLLQFTSILPVHNTPGDYYRFSPQTFIEVFFDGTKDVQVYSVMFPPRIIGSGIKI